VIFIQNLLLEYAIDKIKFLYKNSTEIKTSCLQAVQHFSPPQFCFTKNPHQKEINMSNNRLESLGFKPTVVASTSVSNLENSIEWYSQKLGFNLIYKVEEIGWCEMTTPVPGVTIGLSQVENPEVKGVVMTWEVSDVAHTRSLLENAEVKFAGDTSTIPNLVILASFYDPDGNTYMLSQTLSQP
jgi:CreA protein